jgi:hypothetical protein
MDKTMNQITLIKAEEIIELLEEQGVVCDELLWKGNPYNFYPDILEGESKWALKLWVEASEIESAIKDGEFEDRGRKCILPDVALGFLVSKGILKSGEYIIWRSW